MKSKLMGLSRKLIRVYFSITLILLIIFSPFGKTLAAEKISMSGDFVKDTILVADNLKETIQLADDDQKIPESKDEALQLITAYISRYRNRPQINSTSSFTTMQTALNAMAGHYKTFPNRPIPDQLKERLEKELGKVEKLVESEN